MKAHPYADLLPMMDSVQLEELAEDIKKNGLRDPITVHEGQIVDGRNRQAACDLMRLKPSYIEWDRKGSLLAFIISKNLPRRHLAPEQKAWLALEFLPALEKEAAEREKSGKRIEQEKPGGSKTLASAEARVGRSAALAADAAGVSRAMVNRLKAVKERGAPEVIAAVRRGAVSARDAAEIVNRPAAEQKKLLQVVTKKETKTLSEAARRTDKQSRAVALRAQPLPAPAGPFGVIVADPPWQYDLREADESHRGRTDYPTMSIEDICKLGSQVQGAAAEDCVLWLWCTNPFLIQDDAPVQQVLRAWGFRARALLTWDKERMGVGNLLRNSTEHVVLATRGKPLVQGESTPTLFHAPRREHSRKPDEFFSIVETICPDARRLEMFCREPRPGWQAWGAETRKFAKGGA